MDTTVKRKSAHDRDIAPRTAGADRYRNWLALATLVACWSAEGSLPETLADGGVGAALRQQARRESVRHGSARDAVTATRWRNAALAAARRLSPVA